MKKIKNFIYNNWLFVILLIPFVLICFSNKMPHNDIWFLLNNGRYVMNNGIPYIDPFTIHEGLDYIMQQWGSSLLFWNLLNSFGPKSLIVLIYVFSFLLMAIFYKLCYVMSNKKKLSIILTGIVFSLCAEFIVLRPQIISYSLLLLEILLLELYIKKKKNIYLMFLPLISFLLINFHASMWYFQFVFLLPFVCNGFCIEKISCLKKFKIDYYKLVPIFITMLFIVLGALINPYGIDALGFIFKSYGIPSINEKILEMKPLSFESLTGKIALIIVLALFLFYYFRKDLKLDIRHICFICGGIILGSMHGKCFPWFIFLIFYAVAYSFKSLEFDYKLFDNYKFFTKYNNVLKALYSGLVISCSCFGIITLIYTINYSYKNFDFSDGILGLSCENVADYILENYNKDEVILYVDLTNGGYLEYRGLKAYIDPRVELFVKKFNGKSDIFDEYYAVNDGTVDIGDFVKKYNFTHLIVFAQSPLAKYLNASEEYEMVYSDVSYYDVELGEGLLKLYVKKDVVVLK